MSNRFSVYFCTLVFSCQAAFAHEPVRLQSIADFERPDDLTLEVTPAVKGAEVAWADYELIRRDFPQLKTWSSARIDQWLLENFARVGSEQMGLSGIRNTEIVIDPDASGRFAYRPKGWNRSAIFEAILDGEVVGMVDAKGLGHGSRTPDEVQKQRLEFREYLERYSHDEKALEQAFDWLRTRDHSDGLMTLGEAIAEVSRQRAVQLVLDRRGIGPETVESYAILKMPFSILKGHGQTVPAAIYLRQSHQGRRNGLEVPEQVYTDPHGGKQFTSTKTAVDFGGVLVKDPAIIHNFNVWPDAARDMDLATAEGDPQRSKPWAWGHQVARAYVKGDRFAIYRHIYEMTAPLLEQPIAPAAKELAKARAERDEKIFQARQKGATFAEALRILEAWHHDQVPFEELVGRVMHHDKLVVARALESLGKRSPDSKVEEVLLRAARDPRPEVRRHAQKLLASRPPSSEALMAHSEGLEDHRKTVKEAAAEGLLRYSWYETRHLVPALLAGSSSTIGVGVELLSSAPPEDDLASLGLDKLLLKVEEQHVERVLLALRAAGHPALLELARKQIASQEPLRIQIALNALTGHSDGESLVLIEPFLESKDHDLRARAHHSLIGRSEPQLIKIVERLIKTQLSVDRNIAAALLMSWEFAEAVALREKLMETGSLNWKLSLLYQAETQWPEHALETIKKVFQRSDAEVFVAAVSALKRNPNPATIQLLREIKELPQFKGLAADIELALPNMELRARYQSMQRRFCERRLLGY